MNAFAIYEARWLGLEDSPPLRDGRWFFRGRAYLDIRMGDVVFLAGMRLVIEAITTNGKVTAVLRAGMTGNITVLCESEDTALYLTRG